LTDPQHRPAAGQEIAEGLGAPLIDRLGALLHASPMLRADYERRAGIAAAYREAVGITNPYQGVSPECRRAGRPTPPEHVTAGGVGLVVVLAATY
jgi:hypothetical protein